MASGYERLSAFIATYPEHAIFRRFDKLTVLCLLHRQAEISWLEQRLTSSTSKLSANSASSLKPESWLDLQEDLAQPVQYHRELLNTLAEKLHTYRKYHVIM